MQAQLAQTIADFNALYAIVAMRHTGPTETNFGRQKKWNSVTAGQCRKHVRFIHNDDVSAFFDTRRRQMVFSRGCPEKLRALLSKQLNTPAQPQK